MSRSARDWIHALALEPHPEGGWFHESWRSRESMPAAALPARFGGDRSLGTAIYYLLEAGEASRFHRLAADETWHLYDGGPLELHLLDERGHRVVRLGLDPERGERPQACVPHDTWFAATPADGATFALAGCTVTPGFEFADWRLGARRHLIEAYPAQRDVIERFTDEEA